MIPSRKGGAGDGILYEELDEVLRSMDATFDDITADYIVVFE